MRMYGSSWGRTVIPYVVDKINEPAILLSIVSVVRVAIIGGLDILSEVFQEMLGSSGEPHQSCFHLTINTRSIGLRDARVEKTMENAAVVSPLVTVRHETEAPVTT